MLYSARIRALLLFCLLGTSSSFSIGCRNSVCRALILASPVSRQFIHHRHATPWRVALQQTAESEVEDDTDVEHPLSSSPWNPALRRVMASAATLGVIETAYLTYNKLLGTSGALCGTDGSCASVLTGPYSYIPLTDVPLALAGCVAYSLTALLAIFPVVLDDAEDSNNRIMLLAITTGMGTFSVFLVSLLLGVLHQSCLYCFASAGLSCILAACAWLGGCLPREQESRAAGIQASGMGFAATTASAIILFVSVNDGSYAASTLSSFPASSSTNGSTILASTSSGVSTPSKPQREELSPPPITTTSSARAMEVSKNLQSLNAKMYGAYWCSHCYDQKQSLGKEAFGSLRYVECAKEGKNSETSLCKERDVPGYPTWEIGGKLYPGERELNELEDIILDLKK